MKGISLDILLYYILKIKVIYHILERKNILLDYHILKSFLKLIFIVDLTL